MTISIDQSTYISVFFLNLVQGLVCFLISGLFELGFCKMLWYVCVHCWHSFTKILQAAFSYESVFYEAFLY